jgi:hypothetical protein
MKTTLQIQIAPIVSGISVKTPFHPLNNAEYKKVGGKYDKTGPSPRWVLPDNDDSWDLLHKLFGAKGLIVVAAVDGKCLTTTGNQLVLGGYLVAQWDTRKSCIRVAEGVVLVDGIWDEAASATAQAPCMTPADTKFQVVVRRDFALKNGLAIVQELGEEVLINPLSVFTDAELIQELRNRGYRVEKNEEW